jgi:hypothetical protein
MLIAFEVQRVLPFLLEMRNFALLNYVRTLGPIYLNTVVAAGEHSLPSEPTDKWVMRDDMDF